MKGKIEPKRLYRRELSERWAADCTPSQLPCYWAVMKGFHHPQGSQQAFLRGLAHLYNLVPYQRRAQHAGCCGVEVAGGTIPTRDWFLNLQILTSGGFR
jgi:hypothetical protein